jgi:Zn-dependent protease
MGSIVLPAFLVLSGSGVLFGWAKPVPYNPYNLSNQRWGEAIVAGAGVATNLFIAVIFGLLTRYGAGHLPAAFLIISAAVCFVNLFLGLFNVIPIPPLDGYTVLRGILPYGAGMWLRELEDRIRGGGIFTLIIVLLVFSMFFAAPFSLLVQWAFGVLVG